MIDLSIIIVSFNTKELLKLCLDSLLHCSMVTLLKDKFEIIVVDNGSADGSVEEIANIELRTANLKIIKNKKNLGFAAANNIGIKAARGKYILLLNSDTIVYSDTLVSMIRFIDTKPEVGVATCRVELSNGQLDPACHRGFPTPWAALTYFIKLEKLFPKSKLFGQYHLGYKFMSDKFDTPHEIDSPSGAFYLIKREIIDKVGLLDEDYFMYGEDLDWSYRIKQTGFKIMYNPAVKITHFKKQSGRDNIDPQTRRQTQKYFWETMEIFYRKHYKNKYPLLISNLIILLLKLLKF